MTNSHSPLKGLPRGDVLAPSSRRPFAEVAACWVLSLAAIIAPTVVGCSGTWAKLGLEAAMGLGVLLWLVSDRRPMTLALMPIIVAGLLSLQIMPLSDDLLVSIAPISAGAWKLAHGMNRSWGTAAVDPAASIAAVRSLLLGLAVVAAVAGLGRYQSHRRRLLAALSVSALGILGLGLTFGPADANHILLGFVDLKGVTLPTHNVLITPMQSAGGGVRETVDVAGFRYFVQAAGVGDGFGSYIYSNHYANALILTLPVGLAGWLWISRGRLPLAGRLLAVLVPAGLGIWTVAVRAESRAGTLSLLLGFAALAALTAVGQWSRRIAYGLFALLAAATVAIIGLLVFAFTAAGGFTIPIFHERLAAILSDPRCIAANVAIRMFRASPIFGTGLDSYRLIFPRFRDDRFGLYYAHNEYAQILAETGLVGAAIVLWLLTLLSWRCFRFCRDATGDYRLLNAGPWAAVAGTVAHSAFDWNLHLPANAFLACIVAGLAYSSVPPSATLKSGWWSLIPEWLPRFLLGATCGIALLYACRDGVSAAVERQLREAIVADRIFGRSPGAQPADDSLRLAIAAGVAMVHWDEGNARLMTLLGQANLHLAHRSTQDSERSREIDAATSWFRRATAVCAACQGLAHPISSLK
jgi:O-antigen ligase